MNRISPKVLVFCLWALSRPQAVLAAVSEKASPEIFDTAYLLQVFGSLLLVFACLFGLVFLLKKLNGVPTGSRRAIQVLGSAKVGSREKILLLRAGEQHLLVGVAAGNVRTLHVFDGPVEGLVADRTTGVEFSSLLGSSLPSGGIR